jgi:hypothetical protein
MIERELEERSDGLTLLNHINTDDEARLNWETAQQGKGFIYNERNKLAGREVARIQVEEAAMLEALCDLDYLSFSRNNDKAAFRRLLKRFPHWRCCEGGI